MKNRILLDNYYLPGQLEQSIAEFVAYYNNRRYHESLDNLTCRRMVGTAGGIRRRVSNRISPDARIAAA
jgi:transposase InsO family protein